MKKYSRVLCAVCACAVIGALSGCQSTPNEQPSAPKTVTTDAAIEQAPPAVNLIKNDDPRLSMDTVKQHYQQKAANNDEQVYSAYADQIIARCPVTEELLSILRLDEWQETSLPENEAAGQGYRHTMESTGDGYLRLYIGDTYATLQLCDTVDYQYENGATTTFTQVQGVRYFSLPQEYDGEFVEQIALYSNAHSDIDDTYM